MSDIRVRLYDRR